MDPGPRHANHQPPTFQLSLGGRPKSSRRRKSDAQNARLCMWMGRGLDGRASKSIETTERVANFCYQAMSPFVSQSRGIDVSSAMVELYNKAAEANGLTSDQMRAVQGDLLATRNHPGESSLDSPEFFNFDLIIMSMALHHVHGPEEMVAKLVDRLKEGGMVIFIDWVPEAEGANAKGHPSGQDHESHTERGHHASEHINAHDGFSAEQMRTMLARAGCYDVDFVLADEPSKLPEEFGGQKQLFFARGRK